jgi:hypothetical protein
MATNHLAIATAKSAHTVVEPELLVMGAGQYDITFHKCDKYIHQAYVSIAFPMLLHMYLVFITKKHNITIKMGKKITFLLCD